MAISKFLKGAAALSCLLFAFTNCTSTRTGFTGRPDTLVIAQQREPMALNPALENGTSATEWGLLLFSYLVKFNDKGELTGDAATEVPSLQNGGISKDGRTITYHIRKGIEFADGTPLTARDAAWSIDAINSPANNVQSRYGYSDVAQAQAPNDTTLVLHLKKPFAPLLTLVLAPQGFPILPRHLLAQYPDFNHVPFNSLPIGSGPYVVSHWSRGDRVEMRANPHYWQGVPKIKNVEIRFVADPNTAINLLKTHEVDAYFDNLDY
ncbi:MAG: ABC transporter substrate-binding protein, partial [Vulcanimicrobiaceae bacterium]